MTSSELQKSLDAAKVGVFFEANATFIQTILFSLKTVWDNRVPTAGTNGSKIMINESFWASLNPRLQISLLIHETWHCALNHFTRQGNRHPVVFNMAGDYVINAMIKQSGLPLGDGWLYDTRFDGMTTEEIYDVLIKELGDNPQAPSNFMEDLDLPEDPENSAQVEEFLDEIIAKAATRAKIAGDDVGKLPAELQRYIKELFNPRLPWNIVLQNQMYALKPDDYSYAQVDMRFAPNVYLPTIYSEGMDRIAIAADVSGSISEEALQAQVSEAHHVMAQIQPNRMTLMSFSTRLYNIQDLNTLQDIKDYQFEGGGGTRIAPVMDWAKEHRPDVLVVFTDGYFAPPEDPGIPVIWIIQPNGKTDHLSFGRVIEYQPE